MLREVKRFLHLTLSCDFNSWFSGCAQIPVMILQEIKVDLLAHNYLNILFYILIFIINLLAVEMCIFTTTLTPALLSSSTVLKEENPGDAGSVLVLFE